LTCLICNSNNCKFAFSLKPTPLADAYVSNIDRSLHLKLYPLDLYLCENCSLLQLKEIISPEEIYPDYLYKTTTSIGLPEHFFQSAKILKKRFQIREDSLVIDIGSNDGSLLKGFKQIGINKVLGIEPCKKLAIEATSNGIPTIADFFSFSLSEKIIKKYEKAKIVTCNNILANVPDLNDFAKGLKNIIRDNGIVVVETSYIVKLIENMVFDSIYHEHISYFSIISLMNLFNKNDLEIFDAEIIPTKGGSIRCFITHKNSKKFKKTERLQKLIVNEERFDVRNIAIYKEFFLKIEKMKDKIKNFLYDLEDKDNNICGYGASNTTTTMIYHFGIGDIFKVIFDDNLIKIGTFSPGIGIPIKSSKEIYSLMPDYIYIFAWRFADIIIKKHVKYLENGGKFIVGLPKLKVISKEGEKLVEI